MSLNSKYSGFSEVALDSVGADFIRLNEDRLAWVKEDQIAKYIKSAPWNAGVFIRKELGFANWFKLGHEFFYSKKDLICLAEELTKRNIDLKRYKEYTEDSAAFTKKMSALKNRKHKNNFQIPADLANIRTSEIAIVNPETIHADLARLQKEFEAGKLEGYIDIYRGRHAMLKNFQYLGKYLEPGLKRRCRKWCDEFNYANHALDLLSGKNDK